MVGNGSSSIVTSYPNNGYGYSGIEVYRGSNRYISYLFGNEVVTLIY